MVLKNGRRVAYNADLSTYDMIAEASQLTGLSMSAVVDKLMLAHQVELSEWIMWMRRQPEGSRERMWGENLLISYGPGTLIDGIKQLDRNFEIGQGQFEELPLGEGKGGDV